MLPILRGEGYFIHAKEKKGNTKMKKKTCALCTILLAAVFVIILGACSPRENSKEQSLESASQQPPPANQISPTPSAKDEIKDAAHEILDDIYDDKKIVSIFTDEQKIDIKIMADFEPEANPPDGWEDICDGILQVSASLQDALKDFEISFVNLYLVDSEKNNILSVINSKILYSIYEKNDTPVKNLPTITLAEFNEIKNGMGYQEVFDIIGSRGEVLSEVDLGLGDEFVTMMFQWDGEGTLGANANVTFQGGKVIAKAQFGLE